MKWRMAILLGFFATLIAPIVPVHIASADGTTPTNNSKIIISEVKLGGDSYSQGTGQPKDPQEFVSLYNQSGNEVKLDGWLLEYAKTSFDKNFCGSADWASHNVSGSSSATILSGTLQPGQVSTPIIRALTDNTDASLHLVDASSKDNTVIEDLVGWGTSAPCTETAPTVVPSSGKSIKRYLSCDSNTPIDNGDNSQDFAANQPPSPAILNSPHIASCQENTDGSQKTCEGIIITEILPNPAGTDTEHEFIELYNPTGTPISLSGCSLQTTANTKVYNFSSVSIQPGEYHAFYDNETGLTLANAAGGTVWLLSPSTELQAINYSENLGDDVSWTLVSGTWHATFQPTPNAANILLESKACSAGQERNTESGRCNSVLSLGSSSLTPCKEGQERNADTNRCRSVSSASSSLTPCKAGQVRNPETNRCKAADSNSSASLKPCAAGQERNPATNRCKKSISAGIASGLSKVKDNISGSLAKKPHLWLAGFAVVGATGYGVYEWRQEFTQFLSKIKNKLPFIT